MVQTDPIHRFSFLLSLFIGCFLVLFYDVSSALDKPIQAAVNKIPIIHIAAENLTPFDIGLALGRQSKTLFSDIEGRYDRYLMTSLSQMKFNDILNSRLEQLKNSIEPRYQKELEGVASAWTLVYSNTLGDGLLSWDEYWLLNVLPSIGLPANGVGFGVLNPLSNENSTLIGRNLDFKSSPELRSLQAMTTYQYKNKTVTNIGFAGIISVLTGFNHSGLFLAHFNASSPLEGSAYFAKNKIEPQGFVLRSALDRFTSPKKAAHYIANKSMALSSNILIAGKKSIQVVESSIKEGSKIRDWDSKVSFRKRWERPSQIAVVNCHVLRAMLDNCKRAKDSYRWERLRSLARFTQSEKAGMQDIVKIMTDTSHRYYEIFSESTIQSIIYLPASGYLYLYAAPTIKASKTNIEQYPSYQVYSNRVIPSVVHSRFQSYFWWVLAIVTVLMIALWWIRRSISAKDC